MNLIEKIKKWIVGGVGRVFYEVFLLMDYANIGYLICCSFGLINDK
jgi:hypothetical protein